MENETQQEIKNYADVKKQLEPAFPDAEKVEKINVLNKEMIFLDYKEFPSSFLTDAEKQKGIEKNFIVILAELEGKKISFSGGDVLFEKLKDLKERKLLPVRATLIKPKSKRYFTLS